MIKILTTRFLCDFLRTRLLSIFSHISSVTTCSYGHLGGEGGGDGGGGGAV